MPNLNLYDSPSDILDMDPLPPSYAKVSSTAANNASTAMYASMGLSAIGAITNALSQSAALRAQGDYESTLASTNAAIARLQSRQVLQAGDVEASRKNLQTQQTVGAIKASQGASGVDVASGSAALVRGGVQGVGAIDELTIRNNAARQAWGYQTEAIQETYKGQFAQLRAKAASVQSLMAGGLGAVSGPLAIEANYLRFARWMTGGAGGAGNPYPNMVTG